MTAKTPALFCEPETRDFGVQWFGQRAFGGILEDLRQENDVRWIPQYNLQNFWRRQIPPIPVGHVEPLIPPRFRSPDAFNRLPGHFPLSTQEYEVYNRNLLAARYFENSHELKIWTVNERSKRHNLECFEIELHRKGRPKIDSLKLISDKKMKMVPPVKSESHNPRNEPLLELRTSFWSEDQLFLRSATLLQSYDSETHERTAIFETAVKSFAESHIFEDQLAAVDFGGRVWIRDAGNTEKVEANEEEVYQMVSFTDHPKIVAIASNLHVETVDLRVESRNCGELWRSPEFEARGPEEALYLQESAPAPAVIRHLARVPDTANAYLVMTDRALQLVDDRFPGKAVFGIRHPFSSGGHRMIVAGPVNDEVEGGEVYTVISMDQQPVLNSAVSMTKFYHHPTGIFSAIDAFHSLGEPDQFNRVVRRGKYAEHEHLISEPTRALSLLENVDGHSILLRQTDDGAIWWQSLSHDAISEKQAVEMERESFGRVVEEMRRDERWRRDDSRPVYSDGMCEDVKETTESTRQLIHIETNDVDRKMITKFGQKSVEILRKSGQLKADDRHVAGRLQVQLLDDPNSVLSKITLDTWQTAEQKVREAAAER